MVVCVSLVAGGGLPAAAEHPSETWPVKPPPGFRRIERDTSRKNPLPKPTSAEAQRGYLVFTRPEPGDIYPTSVPLRKETVEKISIRVTPGEIADVHFALRPLRDLKAARVSVDFEGDVKQWAHDLRWVHCWPQRTGWGFRARGYHVIPELLLKRETADLRAGKTQQYYLTVDVPPNAAPGTYRAEVTVSAGGATARPLTIELTVLPFKLEPLPKDIVFGLYPDIGAWATDKETTASVLARMRRQGFTALMMPLRGARWTYDNGKVSADLSDAVAFMEMYKAAGFTGRFVMRLGLGGTVEKWIPGAVKGPYDYTPEAARVLRQMYRIVRETAVKHNWPPFVAHVVDEPHADPEDDRMKRGVRQAKALHAEGLDLFSTIWEPGKLDPYLNYRGYNCIHYISFPDEATTRKRREATRKAGDVFWFYGSGCYGDEHVLQDGNIIANRYMSGNLAWRAGATGSWSWTFMRRRGNPYYDLDNSSRPHAAKDAMTVYPPVPPDTGFTPTLQWEALRRGIDDYRYFHTLMVYIRRAKASRNPGHVRSAEKTEKQFNDMLGRMPWKHTRKGHYPAAGITNAMLNANRTHIADWIVELHEMAADGR